MLDFGFWVLDFGFWVLDFGFWILDLGFGFWVLGFGCILGSGFGGFWVWGFGFLGFGALGHLLLEPPPGTSSVEFLQVFGGPCSIPRSLNIPKGAWRLLGPWRSPQVPGGPWSSLGVFGGI